MSGKEQPRTIIDFFSKSQTDFLQPKGTCRFERHYKADYLKFGFIVWNKSEINFPKPQCVICQRVLSNECMKPCKLMRHLKTNHPKLEGKPITFFERKSMELKDQVCSFKKGFTDDKSIVKASYIVALQVAKCMKSYSIAETLIKPCLVDVCYELFGHVAADKMKTLSLSNDTIQRRICELSEDIESQVTQKVRQSLFAIQLDESTDISNKATLLCYVRYIDFECHDVKDELLCCLELPGHTTSMEIYKSINTYIENKSLLWKNCIGLCTDGAANMTGKHSGVVSKIKEFAADDMLFTHCFIHREHLAAKKMSPQLNEVLSQCIKIVNYIRCKALNCRLFRILCEELGSEHVGLLLHAEVRWLSRGRVLKRLFDLREEVKDFLGKKNCDLSNFFNDNNWVAKLSYLSDIFSNINDLNLSLQGYNSTIFNVLNKIEAFKQKLKLWYECVQQNNYDMFLSLSDFKISENIDIKEINNVIGEHLQALSYAFNKYYPPEDDVRLGNMWIIHPFIEQSNHKLNISEQEQLIDLKSDMGLKVLFDSISVTQFWIKVRNDYPILHEKAMRILLAFSTTYLCESAFSALTIIKSKQRNRLIVSPALRLAVTTLTPRIENICNKKEKQKSH